MAALRRKVDFENKVHVHAGQNDAVLATIWAQIRFRLKWGCRFRNKHKQYREKQNFYPLLSAIRKKNDGRSCDHESTPAPRGLVTVDRYFVRGP